MHVERPKPSLKRVSAAAYWSRGQRDTSST